MYRLLRTSTQVDLMRRMALASGLLMLGLTACVAGSVETPAPPTAEITIALPLALVAAPDTVLGGIRDVGMSEDGVWILALGSTPFAHYDLETLTPSYPAQNITVGPIPVRFSYSLDIAADGSALTWDGIVGRLLRITPSFEVSVEFAGADLVQSPQTPGWDFLGGRRNQLLAMDAGYVLGMLRTSTAGSGDYDRTHFVLARGEDRETVLAFAQPMGGLDSALAGPRLFGPFPLVTRCGRTGAAVYRPDTKSIELMDSLWAGKRTIAVKRDPPARTAEMARELFVTRALISSQGTMTEAEIRKLIETAPIGALNEAARRTPAYSRLVCTPLGTVLIERFRIGTLAAGEPNVWEVYRADGTEQLLRMPSQFRLYDANDEHLVGILLDSLDVPKVARASWPASTGQ